MSGKNQLPFCDLKIPISINSDGGAQKKLRGKTRVSGKEYNKIIGIMNVFIGISFLYPAVR